MNNKRKNNLYKRIFTTAIAVCLMSAVTFTSAAQMFANNVYAQDDPQPEGGNGIEVIPPSGDPVGTPAGTPEGTPVGTPEGIPTGTPEGTPAGTPEGTPTGTPDPDPIATLSLDSYTTDDIELLMAMLENTEYSDEQLEAINERIAQLIEILEENGDDERLAEIFGAANLGAGNPVADINLLGGAGSPAYAYQGPAQYTSTYPGDWAAANCSNLIVFVGFSDGNGGTSHDMSHPTNSALSRGKCALKTEYTLKYFNGDATNKQGMQRYLYNISYGNLRVDNIMPQYDAANNTIIPIILDETVDKYGAMNDNVKNDGLLLSAVLEKINNEGIVPSSVTSSLDRRTPGVIDNLTIVVLADNNDTNSTYTYSYKSDAPGGQINGKYIGTYNILPEESIYFGLGEAGTIAHEFLHSMGYPDLYRSNSSNDVASGIPVYRWGIMSACDYRMLYPLAYLRSSISHWFTMDTITSDTTNITITAASKTTVATKDHQAVILKTPYSANEFFVVEYRYKDTNTSEYDSSLPGTGLIIYRVNTTYSTNKSGPPDMIYVFRPGDYLRAGGGENAGFTGLTESYLSANCGRTTYGTSDLTKSISDNAITYSDGQNSGIVISNVGYAGDDITFDVSFNSEISGVDHWESGASESHSATEILSAKDDSSSAIYVLEKSGSNGYLYKYDGTSFTKVSNSSINVSMLYGCDMVVKDGVVYIAYSSGAGRTKLVKFNGSSWTELYDGPTSSGMAISAGSDGVYLAISDNSNNPYKVTVTKYTSAGSTSLGTMSYSTPSPMMIGTMDITVNGTTPYISFRDASDSNKINVYKYAGSWSALEGAKLSASNAQLEVNGSTLYMITQDPNKLYYYDSTSKTWTDTGGTYTSDYVGDCTLAFVNNIPYIIYSVNGESIKVTYHTANGWKNIGNSINCSNYSAKGFYTGGKIYVSYLNLSSYNTEIYTTVTKADGTPAISQNNSQQRYTVAIPVPSGYTDDNVYIDGVKKKAVIVNNCAYLELDNKNAKSAIMYKFRDNNIQIGMTVWKLTFSNNAYTVTKLDGLTNLLGYHGFSIRVTGEKGIRFKSSISQTDKAKLESTGINGYKVKEMGTVCIQPQDYSEAVGLTLTTSRSAKGRTFYYKADGTKVDIVKETVSGRDRFANVTLTKTADKYNYEYVFRGYIILTNGSEEIVLYTYPYARSVYTVAKQVMEANEFAPGTNAYNFVAGIISSVEGGQ